MSESEYGVSFFDTFSKTITLYEPEEPEISRGMTREETILVSIGHP